MNKKIALIIMAIFGLGLICLQQKSYADKRTDHTEFKDMAIKDCSSCHKSEGVAPNHGADFLREHQILADKANNNCSQCHPQKWCLDCHKGGNRGTDPRCTNCGEGTDDPSALTFGRDSKPKTHRSNFVDIHGIKASLNQQQCYRCHDEKAFCNDCHSKSVNRMNRSDIKEHRGLLFYGGGDLSEHARTARRNLQACETCHPTGDVCTRCHNASNNLRPFLK